MSITDYEMQFINGVNQTYDMLSELDEVQNDDDFWRVFGNIKAGFTKIDNAAKSYYGELKKNGGDTENCSLTYELNHGIYNIDYKLVAIMDKIAEISAIPE